MKGKLFVVGWGRHGKDQFAEYMREFYPHISFVSSSLFVAEQAVFPHLKERYGYENVEQAYDDRHNHRAEWKQLISEYNKDDKAKMARELFEKHDIYVGIRCREELEAARELSDLVIWVDRSKYVPPEGEESMTITKDMADIIVDNNGSLAELRERARRIAAPFFEKPNHYIVSDIVREENAKTFLSVISCEARSEEEALGISLKNIVGRSICDPVISGPFRK